MMTTAVVPSEVLALKDAAEVAAREVLVAQGAVQHAQLALRGHKGDVRKRAQAGNPPTPEEASQEEYTLLIAVGTAEKAHADAKADAKRKREEADTAFLMWLRDPAAFDAVYTAWQDAAAGIVDAAEALMMRMSEMDEAHALWKRAVEEQQPAAVGGRGDCWTQSKAGTDLRGAAGNMLRHRRPPTEPSYSYGA